MRCEAYTAGGNCCERQAQLWHFVNIEGKDAAFYVCCEHQQLAPLSFLNRMKEAGVLLSDEQLAAYHGRAAAFKTLGITDTIATIVDRAVKKINALEQENNILRDTLSVLQRQKQEEEQIDSPPPSPPPSPPSSAPPSPPSSAPPTPLLAPSLWSRCFCRAS